MKNAKTSMLSRKLLVGAASIALMAGTASVVGTSAAVAQDYTTGLMRGYAQDTAGNPIANATVMVKSNKGFNSTVQTNALGEFRLLRLQPGTYTVAISKEGFDDLSGQEVRISVGKDSEVTFTLASNSAEIEEIYVTGTRQGSWDFNSTTTGITVDVDELFSKTPVARDVTSIALLSPGSSRADSRFGNVASFNGSSAGENVFYVNGFNITDVSNLVGSVEVPFEMYETVEVKTGGYSAEFGRSTGGVVNAVTKSGSNEFHFGANVFYEPNWGRSQVPNITVSNNSHNEDETLNYNFWASGPIVKDKLFFWAMYNPRKVTATSYGETEAYVDEQNDPFYGIKLDFTPFEGHRFEYTRFDTSTQRDTETFNFSGEDQDAIDDPADFVGSSKGTSFARGGGEVDIYRYTGVFTDWFTISGMYGKLSTDSTAQSTADAFPVIYSWEDGVFTPEGSWVNFSSGTKEESRESYRVDADFYFNLGGEHHVRVGYDTEDMTLSEFAILSGNSYYLYWTGNYTGTAHDDALGDDFQSVRVREYSNGGNFESSQTAWYIQDSWQATDDLTINLGLRNETFTNKNARGETFIDMSNQLAIRAGFSYDVNGEGNKRLYGSFGRYYLPIAINTAFRQAGGEIYIHRFYEYTSIGADGVPVFDPDTLYATDVFGSGEVPTTETFVDQEVDPMFSDEFVLGYEHSFESGWTVGARFLHRRLGRLMEDVAIDAAVIKWAEANGYGDVSDIWTGFHQYVITNPGEDMVIYTDELPGTNGALTRMDLSAADLGYPEGKRKYTAIDLEFRRDWDGEWFLQGSYTWSRSTGNYEGNIKSDNAQDDAGITTDFDQPGLVDGSQGKLPNHRTHRFKVWGAYQLTESISVGGRFDLESGRPHGCRGTHPTDSFAAAYGEASWYCDLDGDGTPELTPRGSQGSNDWIANLDLSLNITPSFVEDIPGDLVFRVDVFNVLNSQGVARKIDSGLNYNLPASYQSPRRLRLSATYRF